MFAAFPALPAPVMALLAVVGILLLIMCPTMIAALVERRLVHAYVPMNAESPSQPISNGNSSSAERQNGRPAFLPMTAYARSTVLAARESAFRPLGAFRDGKGSFYKIRYDLFLAPDRETLAVIGGGTLGSIPVSATWLYTALAGGGAIVTTDQQSAMEVDLSGLWDWKLVTNADFDELLSQHRQRLAEPGLTAQPYSDSDPLADLMALRSRRVDMLAGQGLARYLDEARDAWRYTFSGALAFTLRAYLRGFADFGRNAGRSRIKRPGQAGYVPSARETARSKLLGQAEFFFLMLLMIGGVLSLVHGPAVNHGQRIFRLFVLGVGLAGFLSVKLLKQLGREQARDR